MLNNQAPTLKPTFLPLSSSESSLYLVISQNYWGLLPHRCDQANIYIIPCKLRAFLRQEPLYDLIS